MVAARLRLSSLPLPAGLTLGLGVAASVALAPGGWLEAAVRLSGAAALTSAAQPPLGGTARALIGTIAGVFTGATAWAALYLLIGPGGPFAREGGEGGLPTVRTADAHPDAPPRRILSATELGSPPPPIAPPARSTERPLPFDLDQPMSRFDPAAIRLEPMEPGRPVPPLAIRREPLAPGERIESVELPAPARDAAEPPSIDSLLRRLEEGTIRRGLRPAG